MQFILHKCWVTTSKGGKAARQLEFLWLWAHLSVLMHRWSSIQRATAPMVSQACFSNMKETRTNMQQLWRNKHNITCATSKLDHPPRSPCQLSASCVCFYHLTVHFLKGNGRLNNWVIFPPPTHTHTFSLGSKCDQSNLWKYGNCSCFFVVAVLFFQISFSLVKLFCGLFLKKIKMIPALHWEKRPPCTRRLHTAQAWGWTR